MRPLTAITAVFRRRVDVIADVDAEIAAHIDARVQQLVASGLSPEHARAEALRRFGDVGATRQAMYTSAHRADARARRREQIAAWLGDLRVTLRQLRRAPGFALGVIATLSLGIAANAAMFDVLDRLLLRPPAHVRDPGRIVRVYLHEMARGDELTITGVSYHAYRQIREASRGALDLVAMHDGTFIAGAGTSARQVSGGLVSSNFAAVLGVRASVGRFFADGLDPGPDGDAEVVLGYDYWMMDFGGDSTVVGRILEIEAHPFHIVGVAPRGFAGLGMSRVDVWLPANAARAVFPHLDRRWMDTDGFSWLSLAGRLRDGVSESQAAAALGVAYRQTVKPRAESSEPAPRASVWPAHVERGPERADGTRVAIWLGVVAVIVLLLACGNVANLMLARGLRRRAEIAVRLALGVGRARLVTQLLFESFILAGAAAIVGALLAIVGGSVLRTVVFPGITLADAGVNWRLLWCAIAAGFAACLLSGLGPAFLCSRQDLAGMLIAVGRASFRRSRLRTALLVGQATLSTILLVGAGLFVRSLLAARSTDMGFDADRLLVVRLQVRGTNSIPGGLPRMLHELADRVRNVPGVEGAATTVQIPFGVSTWTKIAVPGIDSVERIGQFFANAVGDDYFATTGTRIIAGRGLTRADAHQTVLVVSDAMARALWPNQGALGRCVKIGGPDKPCAEVVGIAANIHQFDVRQESSLQFWNPEPANQREVDGPYGILVRVREPATMIPTIREALTPFAPAGAHIRIKPVSESVARVIRPWRFGTVMFGAFGGIGLLIAAIGLYSVLAYAVDQRRRELGIRVALGAVTGRVIRLVVGQTLVMATAGVVFGLLVATLGARRLGSLLVGVGPDDPLVLTVVATTLILTAILASLVPAWRAARVDPAQALRAE